MWVFTANDVDVTAEVTASSRQRARVVARNLREVLGMKTSDIRPAGAKTNSTKLVFTSI